MKKLVIGLIDYGMGNLRSVSKALEKIGASVQLVDRPGQVQKVDAIVLPGVGAFHVALKNLKKRRLFDPIGNWVVQGKPFLGICLGYQLLFEKSEEGNEKDERAENGFGIFKGKVKRFLKKKGIKVPHIGWNQVKIVKSPSSKGWGLGFKIRDSALSVQSLGAKVFSGIPNASYFYFVHSYFPVPKQEEIILTTTDYGAPFTSSISKGSLFACQFHPEKSSAGGLQLLKNYYRWVLERQKLN